MKLKALFSIFFYLTTGNALFPQKIPILDLATAIKHPTKIVLSDFIESITYIPLETNPNCLIDKNPEVKVLKDYIIVTNSHRCLIFNRKDGAFLREIGQYGRGPGEYNNTYGFLDENSSEYYFKGWNGNLIGYSLEGKYVRSVPIPGYKDDVQHPSLPDRFTYLTDNLILCDFLNIDGSETKFLMIFDKKGSLIKIIPNKNSFKNMPQVLNAGTVSFHHFNKSVFFQEFNNDTVFRIAIGGIIPYFVLSRGKNSPPYESLWWTVEKRKAAKFINQPTYLESSRYIAFHFHYTLDPSNFFGLYDKTTKSLKMTENPSGISNDIDGFMDLSFRSKNEDNEFSCIIQSEELISWINKNSDKSRSLHPDLQKLKNIKLGDNPIVVIARGKE